MKKSMFLLGLAVAALASCTNEEVVNVTDQQTGVIGFAGSGLNNITKADLGTQDNPFTSFQVYGGYATNGSLFNGTTVSGSVGNTWSYSPLQYWVDGEDYKFAAYAPSAAATASWNYTNGLTLTVTGAGSNDLVYDDAAVDNVVAASQGAVSLTFGHLLSKVAFKFTLDNTLAGLNVTLQNLTIGNTIHDDGTWVAGQLQTLSGAGDASYTTLATATQVPAGTTGLTTDAWYLIPQSVGTVTFTVAAVATDGVTTIKKGNITATLPTNTISAWAGGSYYLYTAELSIDNIVDPDDPDAETHPIEFTVDKVEGYGDPTEEDITFN